MIAEIGLYGMLGDQLVKELASEQGISLRTGCFCNPGAGETARNVSAEELIPFLDAESSSGEPVSICEVDEAFRARRQVGVSALRVSLGMSSNAADAAALVDLLSELVDVDAADLGVQPPAPKLSPDGA